MKLNIAGLHMETGTPIQTHTETKLQELKKYFHQDIQGIVADIKFEHLGHRNLAEVSLQADGLVIRANGEGKDFYAAADDVAAKLEKQLKKYKGRMRKHSQRRQQETSKEAVLESLATVSNTLNEAKLEQALEDLPEAEWMKDYAPAINHKEVSKLHPMTVDEAIMQMDLLHKPAFLFQNATTGTMDVVYREEEGSVKWVSPKL